MKRRSRSYDRHRSTWTPQDLRQDHRAGWRRFTRRRRAHSWADRTQRRGQNHRAQRDSRPHAISGGTESAGTRSVVGSDAALSVQEGRILGLIGLNGAGKTTALNAILGLTQFQGELKVLGRDPWTERKQLMRDVCFIADVAVLPRWLRVSQAIDYVAGVHPRFDRAKAEGLLAKTAIGRATNEGG